MAGSGDDKAEETVSSVRTRRSFDRRKKYHRQRIWDSCYGIEKYELNFDHFTRRVLY